MLSGNVSNNSLKTNRMAVERYPDTEFQGWVITKCQWQIAEMFSITEYYGENTHFSFEKMYFFKLTDIWISERTQTVNGRNINISYFTSNTQFQRCYLNTSSNTGS